MSKAYVESPPSEPDSSVLFFTKETVLLPAARNTFGCPGLSPRVWVAATLRRLFNGGADRRVLVAGFNGFIPVARAALGAGPGRIVAIM